MLSEHLIYSTAIAIIAGMLWYKYTGRDPSWIIIVSAYAPDFDIVAGELFKKLGINILINGAPISHGDFHNIAFLLLFATTAALVLRLAGMRFWDSFLFAGIGFGAHMFEDALVFKPFYTFLWPISEQKLGIGLFDYKPDLYGIANTDVLMVGLILMVLCGGIRVLYEGKGGIRRIARSVGIAAAIMIFMISVFSIIDIGVVEKVNSIRENGYIDNWSFTQNASWDSTIYHSGKHSAKIEIWNYDNRIIRRWVSERISVKPNTTYLFSSWGRTEGAGGTNTPWVLIGEMDSNNTLIMERSLKFNNGTNDWTQKQIKFKTSNDTYWVLVYADIFRGYGTFWFDDLELYAEGTNKNIIPNSGFELGYTYYY